MTDTQPEQVKYFTDEGEQLVTLDPEPYYGSGDAGEPDRVHSPWPSIVFVLGWMVIIAFTIISITLGLAWILHG